MTDQEVLSNLHKTAEHFFTGCRGTRGLAEFNALSLPVKFHTVAFLCFDNEKKRDIIISFQALIADRNREIANEMFEETERLSREFVTEVLGYPGEKA